MSAPMPYPVAHPMPQPRSEPPPSYAAPRSDGTYGEGGRAYSDRPPPYVGADQKAPSVHPPRARSFTPPLGVTRDPAAAFPAPPLRPVMFPAAGSVSSGGWSRSSSCLVIVLALAGGIGLRWAVESGLFVRAA